MEASRQPHEQFELGSSPLTNEQIVEAERLQHGIAVLDLFDQEVAAEDRRNDFLQKTHPGTESRQEILEGVAYQGDQAKLDNARRKAQNAYELKSLRVQAMHEHAGFLGIEADLTDGQVVIADPEDRKRWSKEHGSWRTHFASRHRTVERAQYREFLQARLRSITGEVDDPVEAAPEEGVSNNVEERAILLFRAINAMAHRSKLSGLGVAILEERYNEPIWDRYEEGTPNLDRNAKNRYERLLDSARRDFWFASGYPDIRKSGSMKEPLLRRRAQKLWIEFAGQFEHSPQQKQRVKVRKHLKKFIPEDRLPETSIEDI